MTYDEALKNRNEARQRRRDFDTDDYSIPTGICNAEYDWGYWDAVITIMKNCGLKEVIAKGER